MEISNWNVLFRRTNHEQMVKIQMSVFSKPSIEHTQRGVIHHIGCYLSFRLKSLHRKSSGTPPWYKNYFLREWIIWLATHWPKFPRFVFLFFSFQSFVIIFQWKFQIFRDLKVLMNTTEEYIKFDSVSYMVSVYKILRIFFFSR